MVDYTPLIARAVLGLHRNTGDARRVLYERARTALVSKLRATVPVLEETEITRERLALEEAIRTIEAEAARRTLLPSEASPPAGPSPYAIEGGVVLDTAIECEHAGKYYPAIARAVAGLEKNTGETRRALYELARSTLVAQLRDATPPLAESEITRERLALEDTIQEVESRNARRARGESEDARVSLPEPDRPTGAPADHDLVAMAQKLEAALRRTSVSDSEKTKGIYINLEEEMRVLLGIKTPAQQANLAKSTRSEANSSSTSTKRHQTRTLPKGPRSGARTSAKKRKKKPPTLRIAAPAASPKSRLKRRARSLKVERSKQGAGMAFPRAGVAQKKQSASSAPPARPATRNSTSSPMPKSVPKSAVKPNDKKSARPVTTKRSNGAVRIKCAPSNPNEESAFSEIVTQLSDEWYVLTNMGAHGSGSREADCVVVGPRGVVVIELKYWSGKVTAYLNGEWEVTFDSQKKHAIELFPLGQAKSAMHRIRQKLERNNLKIWLSYMVVLTRPNCELVYGEPEVQPFVATLDNFLDGFEQHLKQHQFKQIESPHDNSHIHEVLKCLYGRNSPSFDRLLQRVSTTTK